MNIVFWLIICLILFLVWYLLSGLFRIIGDFVFNKKEKITRILNDEEPPEEEVYHEEFDLDSIEKEINSYISKLYNNKKGESK